MINSAPETARTSRDPKVQEWVNTQKKYLRNKLPFDSSVNEAQLTQHARDRVAARLKLEKRAKELEKVKSDSEVDEMTQLLNRKGFDRRLSEETERMKKTGGDAVLVLLDINGLKETNDTISHKAGDTLIINAAEALKTGSEILEKDSRISDIIGRRGDKADEFYVLLTETDIHGAEKWWSRVNDEINQRGVKISAGATVFNPNNPTTSMQEVEKTMYEAKKLSKAIGENLMIRHDQLRIVPI